MRVLGIDPGYERLGIAILDGSHDKREELIFSECFKTPATNSFPERLAAIGAHIEELLARYEPDVLAIETLYLTKNQKTAMNVAEARGVIVYLASRAGIPVREFTPLEIKAAVAGDGRGDKRQVAAMVPKLVMIEKDIRYDDEYDAIAVGITCLATPVIPRP